MPDPVLPGNPPVSADRCAALRGAAHIAADIAVDGRVTLDHCPKRLKEAEGIRLCTRERGVDSAASRRATQMRSGAWHTQIFLGRRMLRVEARQGRRVVLGSDTIMCPGPADRVPDAAGCPSKGELRARRMTGLWTTYSALWALMPS